MRAAIFSTTIALGVKVNPLRETAGSHVFFSSLIMLIAALYFGVFWAVQNIIANFTSHRNLYSHDAEGCVDLEDLEELSPVPPAAKFEIEEGSTHESESEKADTSKKPEKTTKGTDLESATKWVSKIQPRFQQIAEEHVEQDINVWVEIYALGLATFVIFYCIDMITLIPSMMFLIGIVFASFSDILKMLDVETRSATVSDESSTARTLSILSFIIMLFSLLSMYMATTQMDEEEWKRAYGDHSWMEFVLSFVIPFLAPLLLMFSRKPKVTSRTIARASPFAVWTALWYVICFVSSGLGDTTSQFLSQTETQRLSNVLWIVILPLVKGCATVAFVSASLNCKNLDLLVCLGINLFAKEYAFEKHSTCAPAIMAGLILSVIAFVFCCLRYSDMALELIRRVMIRVFK